MTNPHTADDFYVKEQDTVGLVKEILGTGVQGEVLVADAALLQLILLFLADKRIKIHCHSLW